MALRRDSCDAICSFVARYRSQHVTHRLHNDRLQARLLGSADVRHRLGHNLGRLREAKALSQQAFARDAGVHRSYVSDIERGARNPTVTFFEDLAAALGVTASKMLV